MEVKFREKKKYCKDADMYLFDNNNTDERKLKMRKSIKIILLIMFITMFLIPLVMNGEYSRIIGYGDIKLSILYFMSEGFIGLLLILVIVLTFIFLDKIVFRLAEKRSRNLYSKIGGRNHEKYVDADVNIELSDDKIIWTRASKQLNIGYEEIKKIEDTGEYIYILINAKCVIWIPSEAFISIEIRKKFLNYINLKVHRNNNT